MSVEYNAISAEHYSAYRPSLHGLILSKCITEGEHFTSGLDVGCGTGRSSITLAKYCSSVIGVDPSPQMIDKAIQDPKIKYFKGFLEELPLDEDSFDIITFGGSLFYAKSQILLDELVRVSTQGAKIIVYDFEVALKDTFEMLDLHIDDENKSAYHHAVNFSGLQNKHLRTLNVAKEKTSFRLQFSDLAHLVLSEKQVFDELMKKWEVNDLYTKVQIKLREKSNLKSFEIAANMYWSVYENQKLK